VCLKGKKWTADTDGVYSEDSTDIAQKVHI